MVAHHEDELICDMAETYHVFQMRELPLKTLATLAAGLSEDSRTKMAMSGSKLTRMESLLCLAVDKVSQLVWLNSKDGAAGKNRPKSLYTELTTEKPKAEHKVFASIDDFEAARKKLLGG